MVVFGGGATSKVQVLRFAQDDGVGWLCLMERQQQKSGSFALLRMTVWGGYDDGSSGERKYDHVSSCDQFLSIG